MAVVNALPNGYLVITVSPRESVALMDQILDPGDFPWQSSESQMISMEIKLQIKEALQAIHQGQTDFLKGAVMDTQERAREEQRKARRMEEGRQEEG